MRMLRNTAVLLFALCAFACADPAGDNGGTAGDGGAGHDAATQVDAGIHDADTGDSGKADAAAIDGSDGDAGPDTGNTTDAGVGDDSGTAPDASADGGTSDTGTDAGGGDAGDTDAGQADAGMADGGIDAGIPWTGTFDTAQIRDAASAQCTFSNHRTALKDGVNVDAWDLTYYSWESVGGALKPILIRAFAAKPVSVSANLPGVVQAHGLGGFAEEKHATGLAALTGMFTVAYTGPGGGNAPENTSEGFPSGYDSGRRMFDTIPDLRGSWFWGHTVAAMRALTCLETRPEVDRARLGMTGFSGGAVATLISSGADDRIKAAVPLSGTGAWELATQSPSAWQHALLTQAGLTTASPEWTALIAGIITPVVMVGGAAAKVLMVNGSTDEFFPLTAHMATFNALPGADKRTAIAANFDHGCYKVSGVESAQTIEDRASMRASGGQRFWFSHWFGTDASYACMPTTPVASAAVVGGATLFAATVDGGGTCYDVEEVKAWASTDDSFVYGSVTLEKSGGIWQKLAPIALPQNAVWFVDVQYKTKSLLFPERFSLSSPPQVPAGLVPHIRAMDTCL